MTSSITGQSISMDDILISDGICNEKEDDVTSSIIVPTAGNKIVKTYTYKVSYAKIASLVGEMCIRDSLYPLAYGTYGHLAQLCRHLGNGCGFIIHYTVKSTERDRQA